MELATRVLNALRQIAAERGARVVEANLRVGEINEPSSLRLWLRKLGGAEFNSTRFQITHIPITIRCKCGYEGTAKSIDTHLPEPRLGIACPKCGGHELSVTTGQELEIVDVKLEEGARKRRTKKSR
ncbi:MAG: hydrogenase maturation nickel metallochaperone HypA [Candidatus Hodarchaeaceae archaeon]|nr:hydrogenase maturation nickel metallochaperone HypA [Candidatus Hodarchaeaceae archaeon]